jgi:hypothetical protein
VEGLIRGNDAGGMRKPFEFFEGMPVPGLAGDDQLAGVRIFLANYHAERMGLDAGRC